MAFRISGTLYRVTVTGSSTFNAAGIYGRLQVRGKGTLSVNGVRSRWNGPASNLGKVPRDVKKLFQLAVSRAAACRSSRRRLRPIRRRRPRRRRPPAAERTRGARAARR